MSEKGKKRSANFSPTEINLLIQSLLPELETIENKQTDGASLKQKNDAWRRVHASFTAQNKDQNRDLLSLKLKYDNIKRNLKKKISDNKAEVKKTGGGPPNEKQLFWYEEQLYEILHLSIEGLQPEGDCDAVKLKPSPVNVNSDSVFDLQVSDAPQDDTFSNVGDFEFIEQDENLLDKIKVFKSRPSDLVQNEEPKKEIQAVGRLGSKPSSLTQKSGWNLKKRKRSVTADDKKKSLKAFEALSEEKTELAITQKRCFEVELQIKMDQKQQLKEEWEIKKDIINLELKYKKEQLDQIREERSRQEAMNVLLQQEQKLKIDILKCELNQKLQASLKI